MSNRFFVRAAQLVLDAEGRDELPPKAMELDELSGIKSMPSPSELNAIWDLQRIARSMECQWSVFYFAMT
ncbi:hypothetical protein EsDP_00005559 [Epichloe bromicola]|uniref:Uncharacterized protein n=1 Tax=Epichloe bromicola TaxID=79588 RepID=A0ABQ0CVG9_9HYPO